jgi:hypothetical protein
MCRLKVPKIRSIIEYSNFVILFFLYVLAMEGLVDSHLNKRELAFLIYALGKSGYSAAADSQRSHSTSSRRCERGV